MFNTILNWSIAAILASYSMFLIPSGEEINRKEDQLSPSNKTTAIFIYNPPMLETNPYDDIHVQDLDNWSKQFVDPCSLQSSQQVACSIEVPLTNVREDDTLDPDLVEIAVEETTTDHYKVVDNLFGGYTNPINKPIP